MEYLISASQGAIRSLPGKIESLLLEPENGLRKGEKDALGLLKSDLREIIDSYLMEPSEVETPAFTANCWVKEVRELSYDIDYFVDKLGHDDADARIVARLRKKLNPRRRGITDEISGFRTRVKEVIQRHRSYNLDKITFRPRYVSDEHRIRPLYGEGAADLVDIDSPMNKLEEWLTGNVEQNLRVVSIVGFGGVGKTTLAKELYCKLGGRFECRAFVRTSRKPDVRKLLTSILSQLRVHQPPDARAWGVDDLIKKISTQLQSKRYFIIVDDIWTASIWDIVSGALPEGSFCSRILTTTEIEAVAQTCCGYNPKYILKMEPLSGDASRKLFCSRVFGHQHESSKQLTEASYEIARKCGGFPLAIITTASLLASHLDRLEQCNYIKNSLSSNLRTDPTLEGMTQVLNVSYNNLPQHLRACMLYFSIYQEDYIIWKDDLVKQWIAEGFISAIEGKDMEEVAMSYFGELVNRGLIQPVDVNYNDEVLSCTVHYMVLDLIQDKCVEENFVTTIDHSHTTVRHADKIRRLSLHFGIEEDVTPPTSLRLSQVRSLAYFGLSNCMPSITGFKFLRVLTLHFWGDQDNMILDLNTINKLFRLRYLEIACNVTLEIQTKMQGLHYLETMKIDARVSAVEADIVNLPGLLHLTLPSEINPPIGIDHMTLLRTLGRFNLSSNSEGNVESLGKLTNLRNLHLTCSAASSDNLEKNMKCLGSVLKKLSNLTSITLVPTGSSHVTLDYAGESGTSISHDGLNSISARLERLELSRRICTFSNLHGWIGKLNKLCILKTAVRELLQNDIDILKGLPALTALSLYVQTAPVERIVFDNAGFSVLKYFKFKCSVPWLKFEADAMPNLRKLMLGFNALGPDQHGTAHISIEHLPGLKEISAKIDGAGSDADSALAIAVCSHPRNPRVNVQGRSMVTREKEHVTLEEQDEILEEDPGRRISTLPESSSHLPAPGMSASKRTTSSATTGELSTISASTLMPSTDSGVSTDDAYPEGQILESPNLRIFTFAELKIATKNFRPETVLGEGGFGNVYKGWLDEKTMNPSKNCTGMMVAVKKLNPESVQGMEQWQSAVNFLGRISHPNLVKLLGYSMDDDELLLVYEFMAKGSLENHLFRRGAVYEPLPWSLRLKILIGAARGLAFLHSSERQVIHRNFKASNILLDSHFNAKLSDFGLAMHGPDGGESHVTTRVMGTYGYAAPEYVATGHLYVKSDVYGFGVVLLETLSGLRALDPSRPSGKLNLVDWAKPLLADRRKLSQLMDGRLEGQYPSRGARHAAQLTLKCLSGDPTSRPSMREVVEALEQIESREPRSNSSLVRGQGHSPRNDSARTRSKGRLS